MPIKKPMVFSNAIVIHPDPKPIFRPVKLPSLTVRQPKKSGIKRINFK